MLVGIANHFRFWTASHQIALEGYAESTMKNLPVVLARDTLQANFWTRYCRDTVKKLVSFYFLVCMKPTIDESLQLH